MKEPRGLHAVGRSAWWWTWTGQILTGNHDILIDRLSRGASKTGVIRLIRTYLNPGIMDGRVGRSTPWNAARRP